MKNSNPRLSRTTKWLAAVGLVALTASWGVACSVAARGDDESGDALGGDGDYGYASGGSASYEPPSNDAGDVAFGGADGSIPDLPDNLPEEVEDDSSYRAPVATGRYLWSANPESGRVALIDVQDRSTRVLPAGLFPTFLTSIGSDEEPTALVLNVGSSDATRFRVAGEDVLRDSVDVHSGANRWSTSASGDWAVAFSRPEPGETLDPTEGLQEITVIALDDEGMEPTRLTAGYRPSHVQVSADEERLIVVSEEGITLIDLTGVPEQYDWINLGFDAERRDVSIDAAGTYAIVRRTDESTVEVVDLLNPERRFDLQFSGAVSDLDLSDSGRAVAVIRERSEVSTFTIEDVVEDQNAIATINVPGEVFGSAVLTGDGQTAVLYTTVLLNGRVTIVDLSGGDSFLQTRTLDSESPVYNVIASPDGEHAVVIAASDRLTVGDQVVPTEAFSVVALRSERFPRIVGTDAPVRDVALGNEIGLVTATSSTSGIHQAYLIEMPGLSVQEERLATRPLAAGVLADLDMAYAAQFHPEGRVTFFDFEADQSRTLTGFELSAGVVDE